MPSNTTTVPATIGWLEVGNNASASFGGVTTTTTLPWYPNDYWTAPYTPPAKTITYITEPRKIRLKLSEVERLREAAREDEALKAVLQKFTGHIEIEVDFA